ncbi:MAG TPA: redoxin family protein [Acidobacteriota bacterium]|nr:redoxin family protein [Acidobacteriota bacterium]
MRFPALRTIAPAYLLVLLLLAAFSATMAQTDIAVEKRIIDYLKQNVAPGKPLVVSELYNNVFTTPEERKALDRLFNVFFKIPVYVAQHKAGTNRIPTLDDIARQFNLRIPGEVPVLLTILDSDPRVPKFMTRDAKTGEITSVDIEAVKKDKRFSQAIERTIAGWVGKNAPAFTLDLFDGKTLSSATLAGKNFLVYFWFTGCPPCLQLSPHLARIEKQYGGKKFTIVAVNADRFLELDTTDAERAAYVKKVGFRFPVGHMNKKMCEDYGGVSVYPTLFLVDARGVIRKYYVGYQQPETIAADIKSLLALK